MSPAPTQTPAAIFLQWHGDAEPSDCYDPPEESEVTWCRERIFEHDVKYVRADLAERLAGALAKIDSHFQLHPNMNGGGMVVFSQNGAFADVMEARKELAAWEEGGGSE